MSGMLPGVECARRRRVHQSNNNNRVLDSSSSPTRKSFCCLYTTNNSSSSSSSSSSNPLMGRGIRREGHEDEDDDRRLGEVARGAKQRLDEKLMRAQWKPLHHNWNSVQRVEFGLKSTGPKKFSWARNLGF